MYCQHNLPRDHFQRFHSSQVIAEKNGHTCELIQSQVPPGLNDEPCQTKKLQKSPALSGGLVTLSAEMTVLSINGTNLLNNRIWRCIHFIERIHELIFEFFCMLKSLLGDTITFIILRGEMSWVSFFRLKIYR